ncbi:MAG: hypothetical protein ACO1RX_03790 [Candidatus Sericytochromatia bacterium]
MTQAEFLSSSPVGLAAAFGLSDEVLLEALSQQQLLSPAVYLQLLNRLLAGAVDWRTAAQLQLLTRLLGPDDASQLLRAALEHRFPEFFSLD